MSCTGAKYTCPSFGTRELVTVMRRNFDYNHFGTRTFTLTAGSLSIVINKRSRNYSYTDREVETHANGFWQATPQNTYVECSDVTAVRNGTISEDYSTVDCTFHYVDLRNDLIVYTESAQTLQFSQSSGYERNSGGHTGNLVDLGGGAYVLPFIKESVPIVKTNKIICTAFTQPIHEETINAGYFDGVRVLMPLFNSGAPGHDIINIDGAQYDAFDVDWYFLLNHKDADGDQFFWWPDWLKAVGVNNEIDFEEVVRLASSYAGQLTTPIDLVSDNGTVTTDFLGSAAVDKDGSIFFSASFDGGSLKLNRLVVGGTETSIPTDVETDAWYPIAPL